MKIRKQRWMFLCSNPQRKGRELLFGFLAVGAVLLFSAKFVMWVHPEDLWQWLLMMPFVCIIAWPLANWRAYAFAEAWRVLLIALWTALFSALWFCLDRFSAHPANAVEAFRSLQYTQCAIMVFFLLPSLVTLVFARETRYSERPCKLSHPEKLRIEKSPSEHVDRYKEARGDVRSFATLLIQVVTLFVTTATIGVGWFAAAYYSDQRQMMLELSGYSAVLSRVEMDARGKVSAAPLTKSEKDMLSEAYNDAEARLARRIKCSSGTAAFLCMFSVIASIMVYMSSAMGFMISTARRRGHRVAQMLEAAVWPRIIGEDDVTGRWLTYRVIITFAFVVWVVCLLLTFYGCRTAVSYVSHGNAKYSGPLLFLCFLALVNFIFCSVIVTRYALWEWQQYRQDKKAGDSS